MSYPDENPPLSGGALASGALLMVWLLACDAWVKLLVRAGACDTAGTVIEAGQRLVGGIGDGPDVCRPLDAGLGIAFHAGIRSGIGPFDVALPHGFGPLWGLALLASATVATVLVVRWRWRIAGDALALGSLWAGTLAHGIPRMTAIGATLTDVEIGGVPLALGDFAIGWAWLWLGWRLIAELRA